MPTISFAGNLLVQLTPDAKPSPVPLAFSSQYSEKVMYDFSYDTPQSHVAVPSGSVAGPRIILVQLTLGAIALSWDSSGTFPWPIAVNASPPPSDKPFLLYFTYAPPNGQLYLTSTGPAAGSIWIFE